jgi:hypothetical protein
MRQNSANFQGIPHVSSQGIFFIEQTGKNTAHNLKIAIFEKICSSEEPQNPDYYIRQR